jgi:hypothetical protein
MKWLKYNKDSLLKGSMADGKDYDYVSKTIL